MLQITEHVEVIELSSLYQRIDDRARLRSTDGINDAPVLSPNCERPDGSLRSRVIHGYIPVCKEDPEIFLLIDAVIQAFRCFAVGQDSGV